MGYIIEPLIFDLVDEGADESSSVENTSDSSPSQGSNIVHVSSSNAVHLDPDVLGNFLSSHCTKCHGPKKQKGDTRLDTLSLNLSNSDTALHWQEVLDVLNLGEMPPKDKPQPSQTERLDAIKALTNGITTSREPTCYTYSSGLRQRPDVLFHTEPNGIAIDVSLISVTHVTDDIQEAEKKKTTTHRDAVQNANHVFFPFVMATRGTLGSGAEKLIRTLARAVQPYQQRAFSRRLHHAVAVAAAKGRSDALAAIQRQQMW